MQVKIRINTSFIYIGVILFSFSSFLAIYSNFTKIACDIAYIIYILCVVTFVLHKKRYSTINARLSLFILFVMLIYLAIGIRNNNIEAVSDDIRGFYFPVCLTLLLYMSKVKLTDKELKNVISTFIICSAINSIAGIIQVITFNGDFSRLYIGQYALEAEYNYFRAGHLRAFGFMASPVTLSCYLSMAIIVLITCGKNYYNKKICIIIELLFLITIYLTNCMVPLGSIIATFIVYKLLKNNKIVMLVTPIFALLVMIVLISNARQLFNLSAIGRLQQYDTGFRIFRSNILGLGAGFSSYPYGTYTFDPSILTFIDNYGIVGLIIVAIIYINFNLSNKVSNASKSLIFNLILISLFSNIFLIGNLTIFVTLAYSMKDIIGSTENRAKLDLYKKQVI